MDWNIFITEFRKNKIPLAVTSAGVFLFCMILILAGGSGDDAGTAPRPARTPAVTDPPRTRIVDRSFTGLLDRTLPVGIPHADFNRSIEGGTVQLSRRPYTLTDSELFAPHTVATQQTTVTGTPPAGNDGTERKQQPEIDMILNRPPLRTPQRSTY